MSKRPDPPGFADLVQVEWLDIMESSTGDPEEAELAERVSVGYFWTKRKDHGRSVLITTTTLDSELTGQNGYCIYPMSCVMRIKVLRRAQRKESKK